MGAEGAKSVIPNSQMQRFVPESSEYHLNFKPQKQRCIFYDNELEDHEIQMIMNFKVWALVEGYKLPAVDEEILRALYSRNWDNLKAYQSLKAKVKFQEDHFPIYFNGDIEKLLNSGGIYIHGRGRNLRPIIVVNVEKLI